MKTMTSEDRRRNGNEDAEREREGKGTDARLYADMASDPVPQWTDYRGDC